MKKHFFHLATLLLCVCLIVSCGGGGDGGGTTSPNGQQNPPTPELLSIVSEGVSDYKIIYSDVAKTWEREAAQTLQELIERFTGAKLPMQEDMEYDDEPDTLRQAREIVVGANTTRSDAYTAPVNYANGYAVFASGERLIVEAGSSAGYYLCMIRLARDLFGYDMERETVVDAGMLQGNTFTVRGSYQISKNLASAELPYLGVPLSDYSIVYDQSDAIMHRMAVKLHQQFKTRGYDLEMLEARWAEAGDAHPYIRLEHDDSLLNGAYQISVSGTTLKVAAGDYYGMLGAVKYLKKPQHEGGFYPFSADYVRAGVYTESLGNGEDSTAYAYDRQGDHRIMFYNVLWSVETTSGRTPLRAAIVGEYLPDVLGLQELNLSQRGNNATGDGGLIAELAKLGYAETLDPRVENVKDEILADWPGRDDGWEVTVGGKTYNTFYNMTPLLYNTNTTECVVSGYYMYEHQYDEENDINSATPMGGPSSCASKALTWGVFRSKATGETYAVISTHMCNKSNGVRGEQAKEAQTIIDQIKRDYGCPVFFGGDMNGNIGDANYDYFVSADAGYTSLQDSAIATKHTSDLRTMVGTPETDGEYMIVMPGSHTLKRIEQKKEGNSIDQIFLPDTMGVEVGVFGVVYDECSRAASDHLPIFADFSIT